MQTIPSLVHLVLERDRLWHVCAHGLVEDHWGEPRQTAQQMKSKTMKTTMNECPEMVSLGAVPAQPLRKISMPKPPAKILKKKPANRKTYTVRLVAVKPVTQ